MDAFSEKINLRIFYQILRNFDGCFFEILSLKHYHTKPSVHSGGFAFLIHF
jgi:hypothetical protein